MIDAKDIEAIELGKNSEEGDDVNFGDTFAGHRFGDNKINA